MQYVFGLDRSPSLVRFSRIAQTNHAPFSSLGMGLRGLYQDLIEEPTPEVLAVYIRELQRREHKTAQTFR